MIIHVFKLDLEAYQLNFGIVRSFVSLYKETKSDCIKPFFLFYGCINNEIKEKYFALLEALSYSEYKCVETPKELKKFVTSHKVEPYLLHGISYKGMFSFVRLNVKNLNWICWGQGASINYRNWKSIIFTPFKRWIYHHFQTTVVLLNGDKLTLMKDYAMKNIIVLPYYTESYERMRDVYNQLRSLNYDKDKPVIYLGNSTNCIDSYFELLNTLSRFVGKIELHCMLQYGSTSSHKKLEDLINYGKSLFANDFYPDVDYMDERTYLQYMNKCDVYICGRKSQSGLGAIHTALILGKKIYITGKNFDHIISKSYRVFELSSLDDTFMHPLSDEDRILNYNLQFSQQETIRSAWVEYLSAL